MTAQWFRIFVCLICLNQSLAKSFLCQFGYLYIASEQQCYSKVALDFPCEFNEQCEAGTHNSFCGFSTERADLERDYRVCICKDGYRWKIDKESNEKHLMYKCIPKRTCTLSTGGNAELKLCDWNEFCHDGVCLCKPQHSWNDLAICEYPYDFCSEPGMFLIYKQGCFYQAKLEEKCQVTEQCQTYRDMFTCSMYDNGTFGICHFKHSLDDGTAKNVLKFLSAESRENETSVRNVAYIPRHKVQVACNFVCHLD